MAIMSAARRRSQPLYAAVLALFLLTCCPLVALAEASFYDYSYDNRGDPISAPRAYELFQTVDASQMGTALKSPADLCVHNDEIYVADAGNNRILVLDSSFHMVREWSGTDSPDGRLDFSAPEGVYVTTDDRVLVADTENGRLIVTDCQGKFLDVYGAPEADILPADFQYKPTKVSADKAGRLFVVSQSFNMGLLSFDREGHFIQTLGAAKVQFTVFDLLVRMISTQEQRERMAQFVPTEYNNLTVDADGFVYATTSIYEEYNIEGYGDIAVRKLSAAGNDILKHTTPIGEMLYTVKGQFAGPSRIVDVYAGENGMFSALDANRGRIFTYDSTGMLLYIFGTYGDIEGALKNPRALDRLGDMFLVLDSAKNVITAYTPTPYAESIERAVACHYNDEYEQETEEWKTVFALNGNSDIAYVGLGKAAFRSGEYEEAMEYFRLAEDRYNYSKAFQYRRREVIAASFMWAVPVVLVVLAVLVVAVRLKRKYRPAHVDPTSFRGKLAYGRYTAFHPMDGFWDLKREKRGSLRVALLFVGLLCVVMVASRQLTGFLFNMADPRELNLFIEFSKVLLPFGLWCLSNWCVTSLMQGEGKLRDIATMTGYALLPMLILQTFGIVLSNLMTNQEGDFYFFFVALGIIWSLGLILLGHQQIHDYTAGRSLFVVLLTVVVMAIVVFLSILLLVLIQQMLGFAGDFINEIFYRI